MSLSRVTESLRRGTICRRSRRAFEGKAATVELRARVAFVIVDKAAAIAAPSARTRGMKVVRRRTGNGDKLRYILMVGGCRKDSLEGGDWSLMVGKGSSYYFVHLGALLKGFS